MRELSFEEITGLLNNAPIARLGMNGPEGPYIIPMPFFYDGKAFYMRLPQRGRKKACLDFDSRVCIEIDGFTPDLSVYWSVIADCTVDPDPDLQLIENIRGKNHDKYARLRGDARRGHGRPKAPVGQSGVMRFVVGSIGGRRSDRGEIDYSTGETGRGPENDRHAA